MVERVSIVVCRHPNVGGNFTFRAPENSGKKLEAGDWVLVTTKKGPNQIAQCITPQFEIADYLLEQMYNVKKSALMPVTAYLRAIIFANEHTEE